MDQIYPDTGLVEQLRRILTPGVRFKLFTNNIVPGVGTNLAGLTVAGWSGYVNIDRSLTDFTIQGVAGHVGYALGNTFAFVNASGVNQTAYGYFVTDTTDTILLAVARFDDAPETVPNGGSWLVTPRWGDYSQLTV